MYGGQHQRTCRCKRLFEIAGPLKAEFEVTALHIESLKLEPYHFTERPRLIKPHPIYKSMLKHLDLNGIPADAFQMAKSMKFNEYESCTVGDVVFLAPEIGNRFAAGKIHMLISISRTNPDHDEVATLIAVSYTHQTLPTKRIV